MGTKEPRDNNVSHTFVMSESQARNVHRVVASHIAALKNWIATGVETGSSGALSPVKLVGELREYEALYASFNMEAKHEIAEFSKKELITLHYVENCRVR